MKFFSAFVAATCLSVQTLAHFDNVVTPAELVKKATMAKRCEGAVADHVQKRHERRMKAKRWEGKFNTYEITAPAPYYNSIQNNTCVLSPEKPAGPYIWPRAQLLRQDITEGQSGVPLWLDFGVLDVNTCKPLSGALVSLFHCNSTGSYSSFVEYDPTITFQQLLDNKNLTMTDSVVLLNQTVIQGDPNGNYTMGVTDIHTDDSTFLRGVWPTNDEGMMEFKTVFPGYYAERTVHLHVQVYKPGDWKLGPNDTVVSGQISHTGQLYFEDSVVDEYVQRWPYNIREGQLQRYTNAIDLVFRNDTLGEYSPVVSVIPADGEDIMNGAIGYITLGVDTAKET